MVNAEAALDQIADVTDLRQLPVFHFRQQPSQRIGEEHLDLASLGRRVEIERDQRGGRPLDLGLREGEYDDRKQILALQKVDRLVIIERSTGLADDAALLLGPLLVGESELCRLLESAAVEAALRVLQGKEGALSPQEILKRNRAIMGGNNEDCLAIV